MPWKFLPLESVYLGGVAIDAAFDGEKVWLPMKRFCEALDVPWDGQSQRIRRTPFLAAQRQLLTFETPGGAQRMICLEVAAVPHFLTGLDVGRHAEELQSVILDVQERICRELRQLMRRQRSVSPTP